MKLTRTKQYLALALALAAGWSAAAQSNGVPGPADYARFSSFIADRNIFDPGRYPRNSSNYQRNYRPRVQRSAPTFTLVGTMSYDKGLFAFFDGNQPDLRKVLYQADGNTVAGFTVAEITLAGVKLQSADKKQMVELKIGDGMRQEDGQWRHVAKDEMTALTSSTESEAASADSSGANSGAGSAPPSAGESNDILKKLMQQREQELK